MCFIASYNHSQHRFLCSSVPCCRQHSHSSLCPCVPAQQGFCYLCRQRGSCQSKQCKVILQQRLVFYLWYCATCNTFPNVKPWEHSWGSEGVFKLTSSFGFSSLIFMSSCILELSAKLLIICLASFSMSFHDFSTFWQIDKSGFWPTGAAWLIETCLVSIYTFI